MSCVVAAGSAAVVYSIYDLHVHPVQAEWFILVALTLLSGSITVKIPSIPATLSVSETFIFTSVLLFGGSAGTVTVALDGLVISLWLQRKKQEGFRPAFNMAAPSLSIWTAAQIFFFLAGVKPLTEQLTPIAQLLLPLGVFTVTYLPSEQLVDSSCDQL